MTFQTTPVLCFAYVSRRTKSKRGWSLRVAIWSDFFLCNPFDFSGSPNEGWLYACRTCVIATLRFSLRTQTFLGVRHAFLPHKRLLNRKINSFPIVREYQPEITCRLSEIQSALFKLKCGQAKHIRTSSVERDTWPKIFVADENLGYKLWVFVYFSL